MAQSTSHSTRPTMLETETSCIRHNYGMVKSDNTTSKEQFYTCGTIVWHSTKELNKFLKPGNRVCINYNIKFNNNRSCEFIVRKLFANFPSFKNKKPIRNTSCVWTAKFRRSWIFDWNKFRKVTLNGEYVIAVVSPQADNKPDVTWPSVAKAT